MPVSSTFSNANHQREKKSLSLPPPRTRACNYLVCWSTTNAFLYQDTNHTYTLLDGHNMNVAVIYNLCTLSHCKFSYYSLECQYTIALFHDENAGKMNL